MLTAVYRAVRQPMNTDSLCFSGGVKQNKRILYSVEHWDVNNENLHNFYFQNKLHDMDYNLDIFRQAHQAGPNVKLFLNEYDVVAGGAMTEVTAMKRSSFI